jgi:two-component system, cell cycle sensor histidine kinase and response regulator CckA
MRDDPFLLRAIVDADPDMMWAVDAEKLELMWWNPTAASYMGGHGVTLRPGSDYNPEELAQSRREELKGHYRRALETGVFKTETEWIPGLWVALEFSPLLREGRPFAILGVGRDMTERKRVETEREETRARLEESEARYRLLADNTADVIFLADPETLRFTYVSPSCRLLDGFEPEELVGHDLTERVAAGARQARRQVLQEMLKKLKAGTEPFVDDEAQVEIERKDGTASWAEVRMRMFRDPATGRPMMLGITRDRTRERASEEAARETQEQLDRFFSMDVGLLSIFGIEGSLRVASVGWERTLGYSIAELPSMSVWDFVHPDDLPSTLAAVERLRAGEELVDIVLRVRAKDGSYRSIAWWCAPAGDSVYAAARDITDLLAAQEQLRQSQKMEAIGQLAGGIAHDFNNLLTAVLGYADLLLASPEGGAEPMRLDLLEIKGAATRAADLTQQILAFSRKQALRPELISINDVFAELRPFLERLAGERVALDVHTSGDLGLCEIDRGQFTQVLINLVANARDAMPQGGFVVLESSNAEIGEHNAHPGLSDMDLGGYVLLKCTDTGKGMDPETVSRIFEPFFTTKPMGQGTGLGLATVYGIVRQSGGTVTVESEIGKGTTFKIYLPRVEGTRVESSSVEEPIRIRRGYGTILLVEDEDPVRALAERVLTSSGYTVIATSRSSEAMEVISDPTRPIDLLVTDMMLPRGMQGGELAQAARLVRKDLRVLYMSGYSRDSTIHGALLSEGVRFLQKPYTPSMLVEQVEETLAGRERLAGRPPEGEARKDQVRNDDIL